MSSIEDADKILVMDGGEIVAMGTHDELMKSCDIYSEAYRMQNKVKKEDAEDAGNE